MQDDHPPVSRCVLLVSAQLDHFRCSALSLGRLRPDLRLEWATTAAEAMRRLFGTPLHLMLVDAGLDEGGGRALARHLLRWQPNLPVITLADTRADDAPATSAAMPLWGELEAVLQRRFVAARPPANSVVCDR